MLPAAALVVAAGTLPAGPADPHVERLGRATATGDLETVRRLLKSHPELIDRPNAAGFAPLHLAAGHGRKKAALLLLKQGADVNVGQSRYRGTPLQYAAANGHTDVVRLLIEHDSRVDARDTNERTPLIWAVMEGRADTVRLLLEDADLTLTNAGGWTPLHYAASRGHLEISRLLILHGADRTARNSQGKTPTDLDPRLKKLDP